MERAAIPENIYAFVSATTNTTNIYIAARNIVLDITKRPLK